MRTSFRSFARVGSDFPVVAAISVHFVPFARSAETFFASFRRSGVGPVARAPVGAAVAFFAAVVFAAVVAFAAVAPFARGVEVFFASTVFFAAALARTARRFAFAAEGFLAGFAGFVAGFATVFGAAVLRAVSGIGIAS